MSTTTKVFLILLLPLVVLAVVIFLTVRLQYRNGERVVRGLQPVQDQTERIEEFCNTISLPPGARRLHTEVISKKHSGLISSDYSTNQPCTAINDFFDAQASSRGWKLQQRIVGAALTVPDTHSRYAAESLAVSVSCKGMKTFRDERIFYLGCSWSSDQD